MNEYFEHAKFKYNWRKYQKKVLDELENYLNDKRLHIIAPPGSGKTILGLEVMLRLKKPTLILAPTITIKNQWIERFCKLFLDTDIVPDWISSEIKNPKIITVSTYQGLYASISSSSNNIIQSKGNYIENLSNPEEEIVNSELSNPIISKFSESKLNKLVEDLKKLNIGVIILDEAHHLQNEWWKALYMLLKKIDVKIVSLTATPPYDVSPTEWNRYSELCGPVDAEISVPELVKEGDLCPHQDYVYICEPEISEKQAINKIKNNINNFISELKNDEIFINNLLTHPFWINPKENLEPIYENITYYSSMLIFLNSTGRKANKNNLDIIGDYNIPEFDLFWAEKLLDFYLFRNPEHFTNEDHQKQIINKLKIAGGIQKSQIKLTENENISKILSSSINKLNAIEEIILFEFNQLKDKLRLVILTDYIRSEFLTYNSANKELNKIGVIPIFEKIRLNQNLKNMSTAVLSGSIVIIPENKKTKFAAYAAEKDNFNISFKEYPLDKNYSIINNNYDHSKNVVGIITAMFEHGEFQTLIGTKSLLGEGWDSPTVNTLVMASFVGSYVLSNQMRGRAIRSVKNDPNKTGNIWHIICVDNKDENLGNDYQTLKRRFKGFLGLDYTGTKISNNFKRLNLNFSSPSKIRNNNSETFKIAAQRDQLLNKWNSSVLKGESLVSEIAIPFNRNKNFSEEKTFILNKSLKALIATIISGFMLYLDVFMGVFKFTGIEINTFKKYFSLLGIIFLGAILIFGYRTLKFLKLYFKYNDIAKDIKGISEALVDSLIITDVIKTDRAKLKVVTEMNKKDGTVFCYLDGGTGYEKSAFITYLSEIVSPINNPRYIIARKDKLWNRISRMDHHAVPEVIGRNKNTAEFFANRWKTYVGKCTLYYTRNIEGRQILVKARLKALSSHLNKIPEIENKWV